MASKPPFRHFGLEYRSTGAEIDPRYNQLALTLGQSVVKTLGKAVLLSPTGRDLPMVRPRQEVPPSLTVVCNYPGDAPPPAPTVWRVPAQALWQGKKELARRCFVVVHQVLEDTDLVTKRLIRSGSAPATMTDFLDAFERPADFPVNAISVANRMIDTANQVFSLVSGSESIPSLYCSVEIPSDGSA